MTIVGKIEKIFAARIVAGVTSIETEIGGVRLLFFSIKIDLYKIQEIYTKKELVSFKGKYYQEGEKEYMIVKEILPYI